MRAKTTAPAAGWPRCVAAYVLAASRKSATTWVKRGGQQAAAEGTQQHTKPAAYML